MKQCRYQTLINDTLRRVIESGHLEADLRRVIREELAHSRLQKLGSDSN